MDRRTLREQEGKIRKQGTEGEEGEIKVGRWGKKRTEKDLGVKGNIFTAQCLVIK